jgi:hypothetical protein
MKQASPRDVTRDGIVIAARTQQLENPAAPIEDSLDSGPNKIYFFKLPRFDQIRPGGGDRSGFGALNGDRYGADGR